VNKSAVNWALLKEFSCQPVFCHWIRLAARFGTKMIDHKDWIARAALHDNLVMAATGDASCWSAKFITIMQALGLLDTECYTLVMHGRKRVVQVNSAAVDRLMSTRFKEAVVAPALKQYIHNKVWEPAVGLHPRLCPSDGAMYVAYMYWYWPETGQEGCKTYARHVSNCNIPPGKFNTLMRFRFGCCDLEVNVGRRKKAGEAHGPAGRGERKCRLCTEQYRMEDEQHVVFECPAYAGLRSAMHAAVFEEVGNPRGANALCKFFNQQNTTGVANFVSAALAIRAELVAALDG
jgi:hypothetical protein